MSSASDLVTLLENLPVLKDKTPWRVFWDGLSARERYFYKRRKNARRRTPKYRAVANAAKRRQRGPYWTKAEISDEIRRKLRRKTAEEKALMKSREVATKIEKGLYKPRLPGICTNGHRDQMKLAKSNGYEIKRCVVCANEQTRKSRAKRAARILPNTPNPATGTAQGTVL